MVLDISSDDDAETKTRNEDRGKENIPPPDFRASQPRQTAISVDDDGYETEILADEPIKRRAVRKFVQDAMDEDRKPLGDLAPCDFYAEGCDATSYVTVDAGIEKPSRLSKECSLSSDLIEEKEEKVEANPVAEKKEKRQRAADKTLAASKTPQKQCVAAAS